MAHWELQNAGIQSLCRMVIWLNANTPSNWRNSTRQTQIHAFCSARLVKFWKCYRLLDSCLNDARQHGTKNYQPTTTTTSSNNQQQPLWCTLGCEAVDQLDSCVELDEVPLIILLESVNAWATSDDFLERLDESALPMADLRGVGSSGSEYTSGLSVKFLFNIANHGQCWNPR